MGYGITKMADNQSRIKLVKADKKDSLDIYQWRIDKSTRKSSFNPGFISYAKHKDWFNRSLRNPDRYMYVGKDSSGNKIGIVRIDRINEQTGEFDINLSPKARGLGYGAKMIAKACAEFISETHPKPLKFVFIARVKNDNLPSLKVFRKAGFFEIFDYINEHKLKVKVLINPCIIK